MAHEPLSNIHPLCAEHAPKATGKYAGLDPKKLVGKFVKKAFATGHHSVKVEHMWVLVKEVVDGKLRGKLNNDPVLCTNLHDGDTVEVSMSEVEDVTG